MTIRIIELLFDKLEKLKKLEEKLYLHWMSGGLKALQSAIDLHELGILTGPSFSAIVYSNKTTDTTGSLLPQFLYEDIKNSNTFEKFKTFTQLKMPDLFDLINSMGKYNYNHGNY